MKKGFTLVELIGIIVVISLIILIVFPSVLTALDRKKEKDYEAFKTIVTSAAEIYFERERESFPNVMVENYRNFITVNQLIYAGLLSDNLINPKTEGKIDPNSYIIAISKEDGILEFDYTENDIRPSAYVQSNLLWMYDGYTEPNGTIWSDLSGNNHNATVYGTPSWDGNGIKLDGVDDYIYIANSSYSILPSAHAFTLEYVTTIGDKKEMTGDCTSLQMCTYGLNHHYWCLYQNGSLRSMNRNLAGTANNWSESSIGSYSVSDKHTFSETYTYDSGIGGYIVQFYLDGEPIDTTSQSTSAIAYDQFIYVGRYSTCYLTGTIHSIRIYGQALTGLQIKENYEIDKVRY
jgi:competence protein ComGC